MNANVSDAKNPITPHALKQAVIGVGGAGGNIAVHLFRQELPRTEILSVNTDAQALASLPMSNCLILGEESTRGLGSGGDPERGRQAAEESLEKLRERLDGCDLIFVVAGMGGGTGTGAAPVIARLGRELGALVLAVVTLPFDFEGPRRRFQATDGIARLRAEADGVIVVPNQKILTLVPDNAPMPDCFDLIHDYLYQGVRGVIQLVNEPGMINVDFADLTAVFRGANGASSLAHVQSSGMNHTDELMERLYQHPLLDEGQILAAATSLLVSLKCGPDVGLHDINLLMSELQSKSPGANLNMGVSVDSSMSGRISMTVIVGLDADKDEREEVAERPSKRNSRRKDKKVEPEGDVFLGKGSPSEPACHRFIPPPPNLTQKEAADLMMKDSGRSRKMSRKVNKFLQGQLPLEIVSTGRFEKSEPTLHHGENLDEPTYIRRGVVLN